MASFDPWTEIPSTTSSSRTSERFQGKHRCQLFTMCFSFSFNFSLAAQELAKEAAALEEPDGNASSQRAKSNPSSFAGATGRAGGGGGKRGKAAAASRQPRRKRSTANKPHPKPRPTQLRRNEEGTYMNTILLCIANHVIHPIPIQHSRLC